MVCMYNGNTFFLDIRMFDANKKTQSLPFFDADKKIKEKNVPVFMNNNWTDITEAFYMLCIIPAHPQILIYKLDYSPNLFMFPC